MAKFLCFFRLAVDQQPETDCAHNADKPIQRGKAGGKVDTPKLFDKVARKWGVDYAIRRVGDEKYLLLFKARQADAITGCFAEYSRLELKRAKSRQTPIREQLRQAEEQVKKQPQRELTKEAAHGDR